MSLISTFREIVRLLTDDIDPDIKLREDSQIDAAIRGVIDLGRVVGDNPLTQTTPYGVTNDRLNVSPDLTAASDPKAFAQLAYRAASLFISVQPSQWKTRAFAETLGANTERVMLILQGLYEAENGPMCESGEYPI